MGECEAFVLYGKQTYLMKVESSLAKTLAGAVVSKRQRGGEGESGESVLRFESGTANGCVFHVLVDDIASFVNYCMYGALVV